MKVIPLEWIRDFLNALPQKDRETLCTIVREGLARMERQENLCGKRALGCPIGEDIGV